MERVRLLGRALFGNRRTERQVEARHLVRLVFATIAVGRLSSPRCEGPRHPSPRVMRRASKKVGRDY